MTYLNVDSVRAEAMSQSAFVRGFIDDLKRRA